MKTPASIDPLEPTCSTFGFIPSLALCEMMIDTSTIKGLQALYHFGRPPLHTFQLISQPTNQTNCILYQLSFPSAYPCGALMKQSNNLHYHNIAISFVLTHCEGLCFCFCFILELSSFGMIHDGEGNPCRKAEGNIMSPTLTGNNGVFSWSVCSRQYLNKFLRQASAWKGIFLISDTEEDSLEK